MKVWRWVLIVLGAIVALILTGAGVLAYLVSRVDVRPQIEQAVENATGRDLTIAGDVGVTFWPVLGVRAEDATLSNVEGGRAPAFITMAELDVGLEIRPLFNRQIVVRRLVLQRPSIALEVNAEGRPNWVLAPRAAPAPRPEQPTRRGPSPSLREIRISDGEISFYDARRGAGWVVGDVDLTTALTSMEEPMRARGSLRYNDQPINLTLELARPGALQRGELMGVRFTIESDLINATFDGQTIAQSGEVAGTLEASGPSLRRLAAWGGAPIQGNVAGMENFSVSGRVAIGDGVYDFSNAGFVLDRIRGRGDFTLSQLRGKPYLSGRLELFDFDLNPYLTGQAPAPAPQAQAPPTGAPAAEPAGAGATAPVANAEIAAVAAPPRALDVQVAASDTPLNFSGLHAINADLELVTHVVLVQRMRVESSRLNLVVNDGFLAATMHSISLYGGSGRGRFEIDARTPDIRMVQEFVFDRIDARRFLTDSVNFTNIEGRAELNINLRTQGRTQSQMISGVDGSVHIEVITGVLHGVDLGGVSTTIRNALRGELIAPEARTPFNGFSATFAVSDGVLASSNLSFNTPDLRIPGIGVIDLNVRRADIRLAPRSQRGGIVFPFSIRGPWAQLSYNADISDRALREITTRVNEVRAASRAR